MRSSTYLKISILFLLLILVNFTFCTEKGSKSIDRSYYESGELYSEITTFSLQESGETASLKYIFYKNGTHKALISDSGSSIYHYPNGKVKSSCNGKDGVYQSFYYDGQPKEYGLFKEGLENGVFITYYPNTNYLSKITWVEGNLDGESIFYYPNVKIWQSGIYRNGKKNGEWKEYDIEGNVVN